MGSGGSKPIPVSELCVGDLLLFRVAGADPCPYLVRCPSWTGYNHAAFVVSVDDGKVSVCGNFSTRADALGVVSIRELNKDLQSGRFEAVYVRKLVEPLLDNEIARVVKFANTSATAYVPAHAAEAVSVLMSTIPERRSTSSSLNCISTARPVERCFSSAPVESFFTSRLVAEMLAQVGRVHESKPHCFSATKEHEHVLKAPVKMQLTPYGFRDVESAFFTPDSSPMAMPSPHSSSRSLQTQQCAPNVALGGTEMQTAC